MMTTCNHPSRNSGRRRRVEGIALAARHPNEQQVRPATQANKQNTSLLYSKQTNSRASISLQVDDSILYELERGRAGTMERESRNDCSGHCVGLDAINRPLEAVSIFVIFRLHVCLYTLFHPLFIRKRDQNQSVGAIRNKGLGRPFLDRHHLGALEPATHQQNKTKQNKTKRTQPKRISV